MSKGKSKYRFYIILFLLYILGIALSLKFLLYHDFSFTVLSENKTFQNASLFENRLLHAGEKISTKFTSSENNLGIVAIRFTTFGRKNDDILSFHLKRVGESDWFYSTNIRTTLEDNTLYNFGFPIQNNSKGTRYYLEIESQKGNKRNAIGLSQTKPQLVIKYKFAKSYFLSKPTQIFSYLLKKSSYIFLDLKNSITIALFFLPFLYYLLLLKSSHSNKSIFLFFSTIVSAESILVSGIWEDAMIITVIFMFLLLRKNKYHLETAMGIALFLIIEGLFFYQLSQPTVTEKTVVWAFFIACASVLNTILTKKSATIEK